MKFDIFYPNFLVREQSSFLNLKLSPSHSDSIILILDNQKKIVIATNGSEPIGRSRLSLLVFLRGKLDRMKYKWSKFWISMSFLEIVLGFNVQPLDT